MPFPESDIDISMKLRPKSQKPRRPPETKVNVRNVLFKAISDIC